MGRAESIAEALAVHVGRVLCRYCGKSCGKSSQGFCAARLAARRLDPVADERAHAGLLAMAWDGVQLVPVELDVSTAAMVQAMAEHYEADAEEDRAELRLRRVLAQVPSSFWGEF